MVGCLQGRRRENAPGTVNKPLTVTWKSLKSSPGWTKAGDPQDLAWAEPGVFLATTDIWLFPGLEGAMNGRSTQREALARQDAPFLAAGLVPGDPRSFEAHLRHAARLMGCAKSRARPRAG